MPFVRGMGRGGDQFMSMGLLMGRYAELDPERALAYVGKQGGWKEASELHQFYVRGQPLIHEQQII